MRAVAEIRILFSSSLHISKITVTFQQILCLSYDLIESPNWVLAFCNTSDYEIGM